MVIAVLYRITTAEKPLLDHYEGVGIEYRAEFIAIETPDGKSAEALIYYGTNLDPNLKPYHWYKEHVLRGAQENCLPADYVAVIRTIESIDDSDQQRAERELSIYR